MDLQTFQTNIHEFLSYVQQLKEENERLKQQVDNHNPSWKSLEQMIIDKDVLNSNDKKLVTDLTNALINKFELDVSPSNKKAALILAMDHSGSMGYYEKYCAKVLGFWLEEILKRKYSAIPVKYIVHHTQAKEVDKDDFYNKGESGGTICSSALQKANELIESMDYEDMDVFMIQISDGDNLTSDNEKCMKLINRLSNKIKLYGYFEINEYNRVSTLMASYRYIHLENFRNKTVKVVEDVIDAIEVFSKKMLSK